MALATSHTSALPSLPPGWPGAVHVGVADGTGGAATLRAETGYGFRYQYLSGGVNTGSGWATWRPDGSLIADYIQESVDNGIVPVFTYYMMLQSAPGNALGEPAGDFANLTNVATMTAYYADLKRLFHVAGAFPNRLVVVHVEPDLWGHVQQRYGDDPAAAGAAVAATGHAELAGLSDTVVGFAGAIARLRDAYAPNVILAYHLSSWGPNQDFRSAASDATVDDLATRAAAFYRALQGRFDIVFAEFSDRDAAFAQYVDPGDGGAAWWSAEDYRKHVRFLQTFVSAADRRVVMWQIPLGNTKMRAMNNTRDHYQDNRVEWLLDDAGRTHLTDYTAVGVVAYLFGPGRDGLTCACDASGDGVTNPDPINGNTRMSLSSDDDGGFFRAKAVEYYAGGAIPLTAVLTITTAGTGHGTVVGTPGGIDCGAVCSAAYARGTPVTLTATPATGSVFAGWTGGSCSGTGPCTVSATAAIHVTATFNTLAPPNNAALPTLILQLNGSVFHPGDTMILSAALTPGPAPIVDGYVSLQLPGGAVISLLPDAVFVPGLAPAGIGFVPFAFTGAIFQYTFTGGEPVGIYVWSAGLTAPGTLSPVGGLSQVSFAFSP